MRSETSAGTSWVQAVRTIVFVVTVCTALLMLAWRFARPRYTAVAGIHGVVVVNTWTGEMRWMRGDRWVTVMHDRAADERLSTALRRESAARLDARLARPTPVDDEDAALLALGRQPPVGGGAPVPVPVDDEDLDALLALPPSPAAPAGAPAVGRR